jgi:hypothetical protein
MMMKNVKKAILLSVSMIILTVILTSCGKDDETPNLEPSIVGTWTLVDLVRANCTDDNNSTITLDCPTFCMTYAFDTKGSVTNTYIDPNYTEADVFVGAYTISGNTLTICEEDGATDCESTTIILSGDNLTISFLEDDGTESCDLTMNLTRN